MNGGQGWQNLQASEIAGLAGVALAAYLYGSIPFAYLAVYLLNRKAITQEGTGNVGVVNAYGAGGAWAVVATLAGEISKSLMAFALGEFLFPDQVYAKLLLVLAAFVGTNFSIFLRGRGGRGSTMLMWSLFWLSLPGFFLIIALILLFFGLSRVDVRLKSLWYWFIAPVLWLVTTDWVFALFGLLVTGTIFLKGRRSQDDLVHYGYAGRE
ncbi:MAG: glycerol-3-phosphate acyltransferase [Anaerolineae bacterium]|jgi:glycerol-3-phosphate acyltransferase PlsY